MQARTRRWAAGALLVAAVVTGCASPARSGSNQPGVQDPPPSAGASPRVDVDQSSVQDISAALRTADVDDPEQWAKVVLAGRPYPDGAAGQDKLRQVLAQNKADADDVTKITNALQP